MADLTQFKGQTFLNIETFRKSGVGVKTPVWFAQDSDTLYLWTGGGSGKVKRIRNSARVNIVPCKGNGAVIGEWTAAHASVDDSDAAARHTRTLLRRKYGVAFILFTTIQGIISRLKGQHHVCVKVSLS